MSSLTGHSHGDPSPFACRWLNCQAATTSNEFLRAHVHQDHLQPAIDSESGSQDHQRARPIKRRRLEFYRDRDEQDGQGVSLWKAFEIGECYVCCQFILNRVRSEVLIQVRRHGLF